MPTEVTFGLPYDEWGWKIGVYIALIGLAGGAYLAGYVADLLGRQRDTPEYGSVAKYGYLVGLGGLAIGPPILLSHLATPFRAMMLPLTMTNFESWMTIGAYMLGGFGLGTALMFLWLAFGRERPYSRAAGGPDGLAADGGKDIASDGGNEPARAATGGQDTSGGFRTVANRVGLLGPLDTIADKTRPSESARLGLGAVFGIFAAGVLIYSAMAFGSGSTNRVPLWDKTFLVPVQILSGLGVGLAASVGLAAVADRSIGRPLQNCSLAAAGLLTGALGAIIATVLVLPSQVPAAEPAVNNMLSTYAVQFIGVAVIGGLVLPIVLSIGAVLGHRRGALSPSAAVGAYAAAALLVVIGKLALTLVYLTASEFTPMPIPL